MRIPADPAHISNIATLTTQLITTSEEPDEPRSFLQALLGEEADDESEPGNETVLTWQWATVTVEWPQPLVLEHLSKSESQSPRVHADPHQHLTAKHSAENALCPMHSHALTAPAPAIAPANPEVSRPSHTVEVPAWAALLMEQIQASHLGTRAAVVLTVDHPDLGALSLTVTKAREGVSITLTLTDDASRQRLLVELPKLHTAFAEQGLKLERVQLAIHTKKKGKPHGRRRHQHSET